MFLALLICILCGPLAMGMNLANFAAPSQQLQELQQRRQQQQQQQQLQQYFVQDGWGQYAYGYAEPLSAKQEFRTLDGITRGSYSYRDARGKIQTVDYTADAEGFRVAATNLPKKTDDVNALKVATETPEVAAARAKHLAAHEEAKLRLAVARGEADGSLIDNSILVASLPRPVQDTPAVMAAKREFFRLYEAEQRRHQLFHQKDTKFDERFALFQPQSILSTALSLAGRIYPTILVPRTTPGLKYQVFLAPLPHALTPPEEQSIQ